MINSKCSCLFSIYVTINVCIIIVVTISANSICMFCVLHADKAKGLQINLSEALQGKHQQAYLSYTRHHP